MSLLASAALLGCAAFVLAPPAAAQQPTTGPYVSLGAGAQWLMNAKTHKDAGSTVGGYQTYRFDTGGLGVGALGYGLGNGFRVEGEIGYRESGIDGSNSSGASGKFSALDGMANGLYDFNFLGWPVVPYLGAGFGVARVKAHDVTITGLPTTIDDSDLTFAYQGIAGVSYAITQALKLNLDYRYFAASDPIWKASDGARVHSKYRDNALLVSLRWEFGAPPPPPPVQPAVAPAPAPAVAAPPPPAIQRSYLVFFDFDKSDITPEARRVIQQAAANAKQGSVSRIQATGHADRAGPDRYNMALSIRRANAVKAVLVREGIPENEIVVIGKGETQPLVPTPDGVREPQNRRVEILLQ